MSLFPDIAPLTEEVKKFNQIQQEVITLLKKNNLELAQIKELLQTKK